jgi:hypothetical protein
VRNYLEHGKKEEEMREKDNPPAPNPAQTPTHLLSKEEGITTRVDMAPIESDVAAHRIVIGLKKAKIRRLERRQELRSRKLSGEGVTAAPPPTVTAKDGTTTEKSLFDLIPQKNCEDMSQLNRLFSQDIGTVPSKHKVFNKRFIDLAD